MNISHRVARADKEGDGLPDQPLPLLHHLCPRQAREPQLRHDLSREGLQKRAGYDGWEPGHVLELGLLSPGVDRARARALAYAWVRARAQSDTGVGRVLLCSVLDRSRAPKKPINYRSRYLLPLFATFRFIPVD